MSNTVEVECTHIASNEYRKLVYDKTSRTFKAKDRSGGNCGTWIPCGTFDSFLVLMRKNYRDFTAEQLLKLYNCHTPAITFCTIKENEYD